MLKSEQLWRLVDQFMAVIEAETDFPVLIYDTDGVIIRATDRSRIGNLHAGAEKIMNGQVEEYAVTAEEAAQNPLVREGHSCPIIVDGEIVAGFGITGKLALSKPLARIAVKMINAWVASAGFQEQLAQSEQKYRHLFENSLSGIFQATITGRFLTVNRMYADILGYDSPSELMAAVTDIPGQIYVRPGDRNRFLDTLKHEGQVEGFVTQLKRRDGVHIDVSIHARLMHDADSGESYIEGHLADITEARGAERAIRLSEEKFAKAFNRSPVWVVLSSLKTGRYIEVNRTFLDAMGYTREEVIGRTSIEIEAWADPEDRRTIIDTIRASGSIRNYEVKRRTKSGQLLTMLFSAEVIDVSGEACIISVSQDIGGRKRMEERLRLSENNLRITLDSIGDAVITTDTDGRITRMNPMAEQLTGWSGDQAAGLLLPEVFRIVNAHNRRREPNPAEKVLATGKTVGLANHTILIAKSGREFQIADSGAPIRDADGQVVGVVLVFRDVTEKYIRDQQIKENERLLKNITANLPGVVYQFHATPDHVYSVRYVSHKIGTYFGIEPTTDDLFSRFYACIPADERHVFMASVRTAVESVEPWRYEGRFIKPDGSRIWFSGSAEPQQELDGLVFYGVLTDVTDRKTWERSLSASQRRYKELFDEAPVMYVITENRKGVPYIRNANTLFLDTLGYSHDDVVGTPLANYYTRDSQHELVDGGGYKSALNGTFTAAERCLIGCDGRHIDTLLHALPEYDDGGQVRGTRAMFLDISARRKMEKEAAQLEAALTQSQKMEAIGTLAGGIAHDFNNILSAVIGYSQLSLTEMQAGSHLHHNLEQILNAGMRARDLVAQILAFSRQQEHERLPVQVGPLVKEALKMLRATLPATIEIVQEIAADMDNVMADPIQIQQIVMNLCTNAAQAMEGEGGRLMVHASQVALGPESTEMGAKLKPGPYIKLSIQDTGSGISPKVLDNIFNPYFTTKARGKGTGLGLAVVHGIVESAKGAIDVTTQLGHGSCFSVYLPTIKRQPTADRSLPTSLPTGSERILLVDDEPFLIEIGQQMLERLGYQVVTAGSSQEALAIFSQAPESIDLVISDVTMPKMTGDELTVRLLEIKSDLPVILCTGFSDKLSEESVNMLGVKGFLMKPIVIEKLAPMIREVLTD